jgi:tetratricopeptide (TPR) repeat protein
LDVGLKSAWVFALFASSAAIQDAAEKQKTRARARQIAVEAQKLGDESRLLQIVLSIPEDGGVEPSSSNREVDEAMRIAEDHFVHGKYDKAIESYQNVLELDPRNYEATVFTGDVYYKDGEVR